MPSSFQGNGALLKLITGHRTFSQLHRYVNMTTTHAVIAMHGRASDLADAPAGHEGEDATREGVAALPSGTLHPMFPAPTATGADVYRLQGNTR